MGKPTSFKNFISVDNNTGEDELTKYRKQKRKRSDIEEETKVCKHCGDKFGEPTENGCKYDCHDPDGKNWVNKTDEALTIQQRLQRSRNMKKKRAVIAMGRRRAMRKMAPKDKLIKRARRAARNEIVKKLTKGVPKSELNNARKREIERRVDKMKPRVDRLARKLFPQVRKKEVARKKR